MTHLLITHHQRRGKTMAFRRTTYLAAAGMAWVAIPASLAPVPGWAQIEEVVVTSRKTEENLQDIPLSVAAFDSSTIEKLGLSSTADIVGLIPGVQFDQAFSAADTRISIRGINSSRGRTSVAILVDGVDVSGENVTSGGGSSLLNSRLLDLERVEVVKGPQSALYGRNAFAGAINYITKKPSMDGLVVNASGDIAANYAIYDVRGSISGPIVADTLALSLNAGTYESDGYYENHNPTDPVANVGLGGGSSNGLRLAALWTPTASVNVNASVSYSENESEPRPVVKVAPTNTYYKNGVPLPPGTAPDFTDNLVMDFGHWLGTVGSVDEDDVALSRSQRNDGPFQGSSDSTWLAYVKVDWTGDAVTFKSQTSLLTNDAFLHEDVDFQDGLGTPFVRSGASSFGSLDNDYLDNTDTRYIEQEFTLESGSWDRGRWLVGASGFWDRTDNYDRSLFWLNAPNIAEAFPTYCPATEPLDAACNYRDSARLGAVPKETHRDTDSYSLFALVGYDITDQLRVTVEARYIRDEITVSTNTTVDRVGQALLALDADFLNRPVVQYPLPATDSQTSDTVNPRFAVDYKLTEDVLVYASAAKGTKPAGFGTAQFAVPQLARIDQEQLWGYELGSKTQWLDGRLQANAALFFNDYTDRQVGITISSPVVNFPSAGVANAGAAETKGLELDLLWNPIDELTLGFAYAYTDAEWTDFNYTKIRGLTDANEESPIGIPTRKDVAICGNAEGNCSGASILGVPEHSATAQANYTAPLTGEIDWFINATVQYDGKRALADQIRTAYVDANGIVDAQVGIQADAWSVQLYADNLLDDDTVRWGQRYQDFRDGMYGGSGAQPRDEVIFGFLPPPRVIGVRANYRFGEF